MLPHYMPKAKKNANVLRFTPPSFKHPVDVPFPGRCLPVCERCKKNFKTREHCRTRDCHTGLPWSDTYLCITLDHSCTDENGKLLDGPFMAKPVTAQPYCLQGDIDPKTPICAPCKDKNYTRTYCRSNKKHRQLPWSTVYVILSLRPDGMYPPEPPPPPTKRRKTETGSAAVEKKKSSEGTEDIKEEDKENKEEGKKETKTEEDTPASDTEENAEPASKFDEIPRSRTFLTTVSAKACTIDWLDVDPMIQQVMSRKEEQAGGRMPGEGEYGSPYGGMPPHGYGGYGGGKDDPRRSNMPPEQMMGRGYPRGGFPGPDMMGGQMNLDGSHISPRGGMGGYGYPQDMMPPFDPMNMPRGVPRHGEMGQGHFEGPPIMQRMWGGGFNQSEMMFDNRMRGGQDMMPPNLPPHMWPMSGQFMRGGGGGGHPHPQGGGYNGEGGNGGHEGGYGPGGQGGYPPHDGNMMGNGGGDGNVPGGPPPPMQGGQPPPPPPPPQDSNGNVPEGGEEEKPTNVN